MGIEVPQNKFLILDGAMGIVLQQRRLSPQGRSELLNLTEPGPLDSAYKEHITAGNQVIYANIFGAGGSKLVKTGHSVEEVVDAAIAVVKKAAAGTGTLVALDTGPLGELLEPIGTLSFERAYDLLRGIAEVDTKAGADLIVVETMTDLHETKTALLAAKEAAHLPVFVTISFGVGGRTFTDCTVASTARILGGLGVDAIGLNCSLGSGLLAPPLKELYENTCLPAIARPSVGLPDPTDGHYDMESGDFAQVLLTCVEAGISIVGGCCSTSPEYIYRLAVVLGGKKPVSRHYNNTGLACTPVTPIRLDGVRVIGERINPTGRKCLQQASPEDDLDYILDVDVQQEDTGTDILDVNIGFPGMNEVIMLPRMVKKLQSAITVPLQFDSFNPDALETGPWAYSGKAAVNSINGKPEVLERVLPIMKKYGASVVGLTLDENDIPKTAEEQVTVARRILQAALDHDVSREDVWVDCLTLMVSARQERATETLEAVQTIQGEPGLRVVLGVSDISFGLSNRRLTMQSFLTQAMHARLILLIVNPNQTEMMDAVAAYRVLSGEDRKCRAYVVRFTAESPAVQAIPRTDTLMLGDVVICGLKADARKLTTKVLEIGDELSLVGNHLILALDKAGEDHDKGMVFLLQLFDAAQAAQIVFEVIRSSIAVKSGVPMKRGKLIVTTVQGDIHDVGKNIVKTMLGSCGYEVLDLGWDVPPETILRIIQEQGMRLAGLSTLMTTTPSAMEKTIQLLHTTEKPPVIFADGTVMAPECAKQMNVSYYVKNAYQSVEITREVME